MARIAIIGPGAVGGAVAAHLISSGRHDVLLCVRSPFTLLEVVTPDGTLKAKPAVLTTPAAAGPVDWVVVTTKTYDAAGVAAWIDRLASTGAPVAVLQNGIEHRERFAPYVAADRIVPVVVDLPAERAAPGQIRQRATGLMTVANDPLGLAFAELFAGTALQVSVTDDFRSAAWRKLCLNAAGVLNALLLKPAGIMREEQVAETARGIIRECIAVGRAEGAVLADDLADTIINAYRAAAPDGVNSIQADRQAGRQTELDARNTVIIRLGRKHGIATPCNQMAVALLSVLSAPEPR